MSTDSHASRSFISAFWARTERYREDGGEHPRTGVTLDAAASELAAAGWRLQRRDTQHLEDVASFSFRRAVRSRHA